MISVRTADQMQHVLFGSQDVQAIARSRRPGATTVVISTVDVYVDHRAADEFRSSISLVDAPISGRGVCAVISG